MKGDVYARALAQTTRPQHSQTEEKNEWKVNYCHFFVASPFAHRAGAFGQFTCHKTDKRDEQRPREVRSTKKAKIWKEIFWLHIAQIHLLFLTRSGCGMLRSAWYGLHALATTTTTNTEQRPQNPRLFLQQNLFAFFVLRRSLCFCASLDSFCINYTFCRNSSRSLSLGREETGRYGCTNVRSYTHTHTAQCTRCFLLSACVYYTIFSFSLSLLLFVGLCFALLFALCDRFVPFFSFFVLSHHQFVLFNYKVEAQVQPVRQRAVLLCSDSLGSP